jgi:hypothetical protein
VFVLSGPLPGGLYLCVSVLENNDTAIYVRDIDMENAVIST